MTVGIAALGLIGGSFARAYHEAGHKVLAWDIDRSILDFAIMDGAVDEELGEDNIGSCDLEGLTRLLDEGRRIKEEVDGR